MMTKEEGEAGYIRLSGAAENSPQGLEQNFYSCIRNARKASLFVLMAVGVVGFATTVSVDFASLAAEKFIKPEECFPDGGNHSGYPNASHPYAGVNDSQYGDVIYYGGSAFFSNLFIASISNFEFFYAAIKFCLVLMYFPEVFCKPASNRAFTNRENMMILSFLVAGAGTVVSFYPSLQIAKDTIANTPICFLKSNELSPLFLTSMVVYSITTQTSASQGILHNLFCRLLLCCGLQDFAEPNMPDTLRPDQEYIKQHKIRYYAVQFALAYMTNMFFPFWLAKSQLAEGSAAQFVAALVKHLFYLRCAWRFQPALINYHDKLMGYLHPRVIDDCFCKAVLAGVLYAAKGAVLVGAGQSMKNEYMGTAGDFGPLGGWCASTLPFLFPLMKPEDEAMRVIWGNVMGLTSGVIANGVGFFICVVSFDEIRKKLLQLWDGTSISDRRRARADSVTSSSGSFSESSRRTSSRRTNKPPLIDTKQLGRSPQSPFGGFSRTDTPLPQPNDFCLDDNPGDDISVKNGQHGQNSRLGNGVFSNGLRQVGDDQANANDLSYRLFYR